MLGSVNLNRCRIRRIPAAGTGGRMIGRANDVCRAVHLTASNVAVDRSNCAEIYRDAEVATNAAMARARSVTKIYSTARFMLAPVLGRALPVGEASVRR
jgi:hypothetical protein